MPVPLGPPQTITIMSPAFILFGPLSLTAFIASASEINILAGPIFLYTPSSSITVLSIAVLLTTDPSGAIFPFGKVTVEVIFFFFEFFKL